MYGKKMEDLRQYLFNESQIDEFDINIVNIMTLMLRNDVEPDVINKAIEHLNQLKLFHYTVSEKSRVLEEKINIDPKTGLLKYREDYLRQIIKIASRALEDRKKTSYSVSYIRLDIDDFSRFNNEYGHHIGDQVLLAFTQLLKQKSRPTDYAIRFGGEEFDLLLPSTSVKGASVFCEKLVKATEKLSAITESGPKNITVSAGISSLSLKVEEIQKLSDTEIDAFYLEMQKQADDALYESKALGKNRYSVYSQERKAEYSNIRSAYVKQRVG